MELKLAKLPDRTPVKITITVSPQLARKLNFYTELYNANYPDRGEATTDLIPYMLDSFLEADRMFVRALKEHEQQSPQLKTGRRSRIGSQQPTGEE